MSYWGDDADYPPADWQCEVTNGDTRLGYAEWVANKREADTVYRYEVPREYHCDGHTPGDVLTVRVKGSAGQRGWFYVENIHDGDEFPVQLSELEKIKREEKR